MIKKHLPTLAVIIGAVLVCFRFFGDILKDPSNFLFGMGDGIKNYYSVLYQVVHGDGQHFKGMLYPYGDNLTFADGQPVLTFIFKLFFDPTVENGSALLGAMNLIMILGLVITAWLIHIILKKANVPAWFAVPFAIIIAFLTPQLQRFTGHYALAFTFYIPLIWLLVIKVFESDRKWLWACISILIIVLFSLNQPYYLLISLAFIGSILGFDLFSVLTLKAKRNNWPWLFMMMVLPTVFIIIFMGSTEIYTDRPMAPYGVSAYLASFSSVFVPVHGPMFTLVRDYLFRIWTHPEWEGIGYVGIPATGFMVFLLVRFFRKVKSQTWKAALWRSSPKVIQTALIPAIVVLLVSVGILNKLGFLWLSDHIIQLKQFRALGRLVWIFYYVFTVSTVVFIHRYYRFIQISSNGKLRSTAITFVFLVIGVWAVDMVSNIKGNKALMIASQPGNITFNAGFNNLLKESGHSASEFQAILPLPYSLVGSEKIGIQNGRWSLMHGFNASFSTGLPMFGGAMSRTSLHVTELQAGLVAHPVLQRQILNELPNELPILMIWSFEALNKGEEFMLWQGKEIYKNSDFAMYILDPNDVEKAVKKRRAELTDPLNNPGQGVDLDMFFSENLINVKKEMVLLDTVLLGDSATHQFNLNYWVKINPAHMGMLELRVFNTNLNQPHNDTIIKGISTPDLLHSWARINATLPLTEGENQIRVEVFSPQGTMSNFKILTKEPEEIIKDGVWNNYPLL